MVRIIIAGPRCAGKTVLGQHLANALAMRHVEASDLMRTLLDREGLPGEPLDDFAQRTVRYNPCAVPHELRRGDHLDDNVVLTGLRSAREVECIERLCSIPPLLLYVDAAPEVRVARCATRGRLDTAHIDISGMSRYDRLHTAMGLQEIRSLPSVHFIENNYTNLFDYFTIVMTTMSSVENRRISDCSYGEAS